MKNTLLLSQVDKYKLKPDDFDSRFNKIVFSSIYNMYLNGARSISPLDIDNYLKSYKDLYSVFSDSTNNGLQYVQDCELLSDTENFDYHYGRVKKFSALRALDKLGFDISSVYSQEPLSKDYNKIQERFELMSVDDIFDEFKKKLYSIENDFVTTATANSGNASDDLTDLKESFKNSPDIGRPLQGIIFNSIVRGARKGKYYLRSAPSGMGKTRAMVGDACNLAFPFYFDTKIGEWVDKGYCERVLFITTELDKEEIQTMVLARVSGVNESKILKGRYTKEEEDRIDTAIEFITTYANLEIEHIPDPNIAQIEAVVRKQVLVNKVENVFYDYIFSSPSLLNEFSSLHIREDVRLGMLSTALKDLAVELNIFIMSATQLSGDFENKKGIRNEKFLRGAKSIADKIDMGAIMTLVGDEEREIIEGIAYQYRLEVPNYVTDIYKIRRGQYKNVKIWSKIDLGTCTLEDILITDGSYHPIENFEYLIDDFSPQPIAPVVMEETTKPKEKKKLTLRDF